MPKISIINTSHDQPLLKKAVQSIFDQTEKDWELLIIDDCSTLPGIEDILSWAAKDKRVKVYTSVENVNNLPILWNKGIDFSSGKYLCLLDDDNMRHPEYLKKMSTFLDENPDHYAVACFANILQNETLTGVFDHPARMTKENIKYDNYVDSGCMMWKRSLIDEVGWFDERLRSCDDWDYVKRIMLQTDKGFGIIPDPLSYYRWHDKNRSYIKATLDDVENHNFIVMKKNYNRVLNLLLFHQDKDKITLSQNNVLEGICSAFKHIPFVNFNRISVSQAEKKMPEYLYDIVFNFAPFSIDDKMMEKVSRHGRETINFHIEDPQAFGLNYERAKYATYVITNDLSVMEAFEDAVGYGNCSFCPSVSLDDINLELKYSNEKDFGVVFYGYSYDSRKKFVRKLEPELNKMGYPLTVIGGGWDSKRKNYIGELSQAKSVEVLSRSKIVILRNRENTDLGGDENSIAPQSVVRGYFEAGCGSLVMINNSRKHHSFDGEVIFYDDLDDLKKKIDFYMKNDNKREKVAKQGQARALRDFTYRVRMTKLINVVRSRRFGYEIQ